MPANLTPPAREGEPVLGTTSNRDPTSTQGKLRPASFLGNWVQGLPAEGSVKPTAGFTLDDVIYPSLSPCPAHFSFAHSPANVLPENRPTVRYRKGERDHDNQRA